MEVNTTSTTDPVNMYNYVNNLVLNPVVFIIIFIIIAAYFVLFSGLGNSTNGQQPGTESSSNVLVIIVIAILIILILINAFQYFFSIDISATIKNFFTNKPEIDIVVDQTTYEPVPEITFRKQVFNIPGNYYTYENAKAMCKAYGANLATYKQIENAYKNGAEWCNYGWSAEQLALFPTQQQTYDNLQKIPEHGRDCGRPGINGGYIANKQVKFGVNCYGDKPDITIEEEELMKITSPYPETVEDIAFQKQVDYWKNNINDVLVSPFNYNAWSEK
jgi:hypothetical protein